MAAKFFTGLPLDGPDPECVLGHGEHALVGREGTPVPKPSLDHSKPSRPVAVAMGPAHRALPATPPRPPDRPCDESPLAASGLGS
jgi:hypothetical protein